MERKEIAKAVVEQVLNMLQNDVIEGNRFESFIGWLEDGEVFHLNGMSDDDVETAMEIAHSIESEVDTLHWKMAKLCDTQ